MISRQKLRQARSDPLGDVTPSSECVFQACHLAPDPADYPAGATGKYQDELITTGRAAEFLKTSPRTLEKWRRDGAGPPFVRISHRCVRYRIRDLVSWTESRIPAIYRESSKEGER